MTFTYFENPLKYSPFSEGLTTCSICGVEKICFDASLFYGEDQIEAICQECLSGGKLADKDIVTCQGDIEELQTQLRDIHPDWSDEQVDDEASKKTFALEKTTPHLITWQDWEWPCADGDYCKFIGYGSKALYASLAPGTDGKQLFNLSFYYTIEDDADAETFWEELLPEEAINDYEESAEHDTLFYVFRSLHSDIIVTLWDAS